MSRIKCQNKSAEELSSFFSAPRRQKLITSFDFFGDEGNRIPVQQQIQVNFIYMLRLFLR